MVEPELADRTIARRELRECVAQHLIAGGVWRRGATVGYSPTVRVRDGVV